MSEIWTKCKESIDKKTRTRVLLEDARSSSSLAAAAQHIGHGLESNHRAKQLSSGSAGSGEVLLTYLH